jgi:hypothetical protein
MQVAWWTTLTLAGLIDDEQAVVCVLRRHLNATSLAPVIV